jgi:restriction system protein
MAKKQSLVGQLYAAHLKKKQQREREERQAQKEYLAATQKLQKELEREEERRRRDAERAEHARLREETRAAQARQREVAQADKQRQQQVATQARQRQQEEAVRQRQEQQRQLDVLAAETEVKTAAIQAQIEALHELLQQRNTSLAGRSREIEQAFNTGGAEALVDAVQRNLAASVHPDGLTGAYAAVFRPEARELLIECELPRQEVVPTVTAYRFARTKKLVQPEPRKESEVKKLYEQVLARVVLRTLAEAFDVTPVTLVHSIALNGYVSTKDRATGKPVRPCLISVNAEREAFSEILLDEPALDPALCLRSFLNAIVSPHPYDLEGVRPVLQFDLSKYKFIEEMDVMAGLDSRPDLLDLKPVEFEHLIRALFEKMGMKSWVTQGSKDDGVDGVAINEDPIVGGLCIIQAKRYSKIVGLEAVHALAGVMNDKQAAKGVLVTTSWVGKASRDFAHRNGRIEIIEGRHLKSLLKEFMNLDVLIGLPKLPPGWDERDLG